MAHAIQQHLLRQVDEFERLSIAEIIDRMDDCRAPEEKRIVWKKKTYGRMEFAMLYYMQFCVKLNEEGPRHGIAPFHLLLRSKQWAKDFLNLIDVNAPVSYVDVDAILPLAIALEYRVDRVWSTVLTEIRSCVISSDSDHSPPIPSSSDRSDLEQTNGDRHSMADWLITRHEKGAILRNSVIFWNYLHFCMSFFLSSARCVLRKLPLTTKLKVQVICLARVLNKLFSSFFQFPRSINSSYVITKRISPLRQAISVRQWDILYKQITKKKEYMQSARDFILKWSASSVMLDQFTWKRKDLHIDQILIRTTNRTGQPLFEETILPQYDNTLLHELKYVNMPNTILDMHDYYGKMDGTNLPLCTSLLLLHDCYFWFEHNSGAPKWIPLHVVLNCEMPWPNALCTYPKIVQLGRNMWALYHEGILSIDHFSAVLYHYRAILANQYDNSFPSDASQERVCTIARFLTHPDDSINFLQEENLSDIQEFSKEGGNDRRNASTHEEEEVNEASARSDTDGRARKRLKII